MKKQFFTGHLLRHLRVLFFGLPKGSFISFDVTGACNLRCRHCYYFKNPPTKDLTVDEWDDRIEELERTYPLLYSATWVGGEPLLRPEVIERNKHRFLRNFVVTNGTMEFPPWRDVQFHVSIDGYGEMHDRVRNRKGLYETLKRNIERSPDVDITGAMVVNDLNKNSIEKVLEDFRNSRVSGFIFDFYTPTVSNPDDELYLDPEERDRIIDHIIDLKRTRYGDLLFLPEEMYALMKSDRMERVVGDCPLLATGISVASNGSIKEKCVMGVDADCSRCGCMVPYYVYLWRDRRFIVKSLAEMAKKKVFRGSSR